MKKKKRVNISVDKVLLEKAKKKLDMFGGKLSTLFNAYLSDFVSSMDKKLGGKKGELSERVRKLEEKVRKLEGRGS